MVGEAAMRSTAFVLLFSLLVVSQIQAHPIYDTNHRSPDVQRRRDEVDGFLPRTVTPIHYDIEIAPDIYTNAEPPFNFTGLTRVYVNCTEETDAIVLNTYNHAIIGADVRNDPANVVRPPSPILLEWSLKPEANFITLNTANPLQVGFTYIILVYFNGSLSNDDVGLNYNSYVDTDGSTKYIVSTNLQELGARRLFPCFDEPDLKATFNITILSRPPMVTLSNMPEISTQNRSGGWIAHVFATTPKMSPYLVSVIVGDLVAVPANNWQNYTTYPVWVGALCSSHNHINEFDRHYYDMHRQTVTLYARPQVASQLSFAASIVAPLQKWLEDTTGVPYPLPKMDHIAIPAESWELESWGAITYGETYILLNQQYSGAGGRLRIARTIAHELAHQWFGNLVTFKTYADVWLREGFAQHYGFHALNALGWPGSEFQQADDDEGTLDYLNYDSLNTSDPVRKEVRTVWDSDAASEGSTYQKGGALVRQLQGVLTASTFRTALGNFLKKYSYDTATTDDLWAELSAQAGLDGRPLDVGSVTNAWLNQWGYPLVFVTNNGNGTATATPRQYFSPLGQVASTPSPYNYRWDIPVTIAVRTTTDFDTGATQWIPNEATTFQISNIPTAPTDWFVLNSKQRFFYRVDYDLANRANIVNQLKTDHTVLPTESRTQHIDDTFQLSETLNTQATVAMELSLYLANETEYGPWHLSLRHLRIFDRLLQSFLWYANFKRYMSSRVLPLYQQLGWVYDDSENPFQQLLRRDILINACYYGLSDCYDRALAEYDLYKANPDTNSIDPNNLPTVLCSGVASGVGSDWSFVFQQYQNRIQSTVREERYAYLFALACSSDTFWLDRYLSYVIQGTLISPRDHDAAIFFILQNRVGLPIIRQYFYNSWSNVPATISKIDRLRDITKALKSLPDSSDFNNFVGLHPPTSAAEADAFFQMDRLINQNVDWIDSNELPLDNWLIENVRDLAAMKIEKSQLPISPMAHFEFLEKY